ncbi:sulfurtransferase TusA family protein [Roseovarius aquimarinus]|uniref:Sulfurtransferase TusA family protein n=1 Tax=Roseovarius aquimarinus TaxID=1229156 RepID=A0ABW7I2V5_9RHOB
MTEIDAIGLLCPLPVLRLRKRLSALPEGAEVRLLCDDPAAAVDVPHFCAEAGHALVSIEDEAAHSVYRVRKGG